jgi:CrcB protein
VLRRREKNATNAGHLDLVSESTGVWVLREELEGSSKFVLEQAWSLSAIAPPPSRFLTNLIRGESCWLYEHADNSVRFVELREKLLCVDEFATICLRDRFPQLPLLRGGETEGSVFLVTENSDSLAFREGPSFNHDLAIRNSPCDDLHGASLLRSRRTIDFEAMRFLLICLGGAIGTGARYLTSLWALAAFGAAFPFGTLIVNAVGSFLIAFIVETAGTTNAISPNVRLMLTAGVMGGFTTYSAFNFETTAYLRMGSFGTALANVGVTLFGCLAAGFAGVALARVLFGR